MIKNQSLRRVIRCDFVDLIKEKGEVKNDGKIKNAHNIIER